MWYARHNEKISFNIYNRSEIIARDNCEKPNRKRQR